MGDSTRERRRRQRVAVHLGVVLVAQGQEIPVQSRNLSLKGLACEAHPLLQPDMPCTVVISLSRTLRASIRGRVVRVAEGEAAIDFEAMDPDSFLHLRKIVEYHARYPEAISRELVRPAFPLSVVPVPGKKRFKKLREEDA